MPIAIKHLTYTYMPDSPFQATAVNDVSLEIADGEFVGLIGHTGSGKSTLIQHMNGLMKPCSGEIYVDGVSTSAKGEALREIRRRVGLVFQYPEYQLFEETVLRDIAFGPKNMGLSEEEACARAKEAAQMVGLPGDALDKSPFDLSGGQKRRVAIAGVLAMQPRVLVLDEPAAGLDPRGRESMLALMRELHARGGLTLVMVSHSMNDVAEMCGRIVVMNKGRIAFDGTPDEVFSHAAELLQMGLGVPDAAVLGSRLREKGFDLPENIWRMRDMADRLAALLTKKGGAAGDGR